MWFTCLKAKKNMSGYLDSGDARAQKELEAHLKDCARCALDFKEFGDLRQSLKGIPKYKAPQGFSGRTMRRIRGNALENERPLKGRKLLFGFAQAVALGAVIALGMISGNFLVSNVFGEAGLVNGPGTENINSQGVQMASSQGGSYFQSQDSDENGYFGQAEDVNEK